MADRLQDRDRLNIPGSPACGQWETLLVDAMDGLLRAEDEAIFSSHMATCAACTEMFEQVRRGREWLEFLSPEPQVPSSLLDKILAETGHGKFNFNRTESNSLAVEAGELGDQALGGAVAPMPPVWQQAGFSSRMRRFAEPRLLMTAAMAFFSIALTLSLTGVRISRVSMSDLKPSSVRSVVEKRIMTASTPLVRYYDHLRFVYEVESRMRELRRSSDAETVTPGQEAPRPSGDGQTNRRDGGSQLAPAESPLQTVSPSSPEWGGDTVEADLNLDRNLESQAEAALEPVDTFPGGARSAGSALVETSFYTIGTTAMPGRS